MVDDEELLLAVLNSAPVVRGRPADALTGNSGRVFVVRFGGSGSREECEQLRQVRDALQRVVRDDAAPTEQLAHVLEGTALVPQVSAQGIRWTVRTDPGKEVTVRTVLAWSRIVADAPGRLRSCANDECNLFLIDRSKPGTAKWCSMATCGNRMKARAHASRRTGSAATP